MSRSGRRERAEGGRRAGDLFIVGLPGKELGADDEALLLDVQPGGVILFSRNVESAEQLGALVAEIRRAAPGALLYCDAEGGRVDRLAGIVGPAPAGAALARGAPELARRAGRWVGESLRLFGFDVDFAPVVDLDHGEEANALDGRYLGRRPAKVVPRARAFLEGLHQAGVGGCVKHFPGLGPSRGDTHFETGLVEGEAEELAPDLEPFARLADLAGAVMVAHAVFPGLDPERRPASLSRSIASLLLRGRLGFSGVAVADDLEMLALEPWGGLAERSEAALVAGCDLLPVCHTLEAVPEVLDRLERPELAGRIAEARERLAAYRRALHEHSPAEPPDLATVRQRLAEVAVEAQAASA
jgi:beta-N-acetylhexosaminidase